MGLQSLHELQSLPLCGNPLPLVAPPSPQLVACRGHPSFHVLCTSFASPCQHPWSSGQLGFNKDPSRIQRQENIHQEGTRRPLCVQHRPGLLTGQCEKWTSDLASCIEGAYRVCASRLGMLRLKAVISNTTRRLRPMSKRIIHPPMTSCRHSQQLGWHPATSSASHF